MTTKSEIDDEMSVQVIFSPKNKPKKKVNTTSDVCAKEMEYQKMLKWLKDHGELRGEEGNNPGEQSSGNESSRQTPMKS